jgi:hypothetical protein
MHDLHVHNREVQIIPKRTSVNIDVDIPTVDEFAEQFPHYGPRARGEGRRYFELVMTPETFIDASALTRCQQVPAVTAIADAAVKLAGGKIADTDKQYLGALMCTLMEHNGFAKSGRKGSVPHKDWNRGEVYVQQQT